ncbi:MAG: sigma 54-interacting transcriptional regulator, partial [Planctomycetota bacterium]
MPALFVVEGPNRGARLALVPACNRIGRSPSVEVPLPDPAVSREHAAIEIGSKGWRVRDLESKNRTFLNGLPLVGEAPLSGGDEVRIGDTVVVFVDDSDEGPGEFGGSGSTLTLSGQPAQANAQPSRPRRSRLVPVAARARYLIGRSEAIQRVSEVVARCAPLKTTVLITGETGTGKELVARALHNFGPRRSAPFLAINCATLDPALLSSELFGHERGAFTGAVARRIGKLELGGEGTVFLDEVGELPPEAQAKLLRALEERRFQRLGGQSLIETKARFVCATHRDLPELIAEGRFREDLFYRLRVVELSVPPLRDRPDDLVPLAEHFFSKLREEIPAMARRFGP